MSLCLTIATLLLTTDPAGGQVPEPAAAEIRLAKPLASALQARDLDRLASWVDAELRQGRGQKAARQLVLAMKAKDPVVRWEAARMLPRLGVDAVGSFPALLQCTNDKDEMVRWAAAEALRDLAPLAASQAIDLLVEALKDDDPLVRWAAVEAVAAIGPSARKAEPILQRIVRYDEDEIVRREALIALQAVAPDRFPSLGMRDLERRTTPF